MNLLDLLLLIPIAIGAIRGGKKGFIIEVLSLFTSIISIFGGFYFLNWGLSFLLIEFDFSSKLAPVIVFIILFLIITFIVNTIGKILSKIVQVILLGGVDKLAGAFVGAFIWIFLISTFLWIGDIFKISLPNEWEERSLLFEYIKPVAPAIAGILEGILPSITDMFESLNKLMDTTVK